MCTEYNDTVYNELCNNAYTYMVHYTIINATKREYMYLLIKHEWWVLIKNKSSFTRVPTTVSRANRKHKRLANRSLLVCEHLHIFTGKSIDNLRTIIEKVGMRT
jgi:hypothetical protein